MKRKLLYLGRWILNLFKVDKPQFEKFEYLDFILGKKAYILVSFEIKNAFYLKIRNTGFYSFKKNISAYIAIPKNLNDVTITISNSWRSQSLTLPLKKIIITEKINFELEPTKGLKKLIQIQSSIPFPKIFTKKTVLNSLKIEIINLNKISSVQNINYIKI